MLHPHIPHELKDFSKHLFATFLGLLMALGLESWHQEHARKKAATESYRVLLDEVRANQQEIEGMLNSFDKASALNQVTVEQLERLVRNRRKNLVAPIPSDMKIAIAKPDGVYRVSAWSVAVSAQHLNRFPKEQIGPLSEHYDLLRRFQAVQDREFLLAGLARLLPVRDKAQMNTVLADMTLGELEQALASMRSLQNQLFVFRRMTVFLQKGAAEILKAAPGH